MSRPSQTIAEALAELQASWEGLQRALWDTPLGRGLTRLAVWLLDRLP